jgi:DnaJ family protein C protein 2
MSDEDQRRVYDSEDCKFDNSIPMERPSCDEEFFSAFRPVFDRNACWSSKQPVPHLGDACTPIETVLAFYDFWASFASWREFNADLVTDLMQASCREEKRWLRRQIDKEKKERKAEENARIRCLVENARKWDPRVIKYKAELAAAAAAAKAEKERLIALEKEAQAQAAKAAAEAKVARSATFVNAATFFMRFFQAREEADEKERKRIEKEEKEAMKILLRDQRRRIRIKCDEFDMNRSHTEDLSLALPLEQVCYLLSHQIFAVLLPRVLLY